MNPDNPLFNFILQKTAWDIGILPLVDNNYDNYDMSLALEQLDAEEAQKLKRKFRKLWRKTIRRNKHMTDTISKKYYGVNNSHPSGRQKQLRKTYVYYELLRQAGENFRTLEKNVEHSDTNNL